MTVRVFHFSDRLSMDQRLAVMMGYEPVAHEAAVREAWLAGGYDLVASVDTDDLDRAYAATNSIEQGWWECPQWVVAHFAGDGCRSTSVGDVLVKQDGTVHVVASLGFTPMYTSPVLDHSHFYVLLKALRPAVQGVSRVEEDLGAPGPYVRLRDGVLLWQTVPGLRTDACAPAVAAELAWRERVQLRTPQHKELV